MAPKKLAYMLNDINGLFKFKDFSLEEVNVFEDVLHRINLQRVRILSFFMILFNVFSLLLCIYYCFNIRSQSTSPVKNLVVFHAVIGVLFFTLYLLSRYVSFSNIPETKKSRYLVWAFSLLSIAFLCGTALVARYTGAVPSLTLMLFCGILIVFYRKLVDLLVLFVVGFSVALFVLYRTINEPISYSGQLINLFIFSIIFFMIARTLYFNKIRELAHKRQLENQEDQLKDKSSRLMNVENTLSSINRNLLQGLFRMDCHGALIYANDFLIQLFGYHSAEEMMSDWNLRKILTKIEINRVNAVLTKNGFVKDYEIKYTRKDGSIFWGLLNCTVSTLENNAYYDGIIIDNTDRKKNEKILENLSLVASKTDNAVFIIDKEEKIEWVNESFHRITGYSWNEAVGNKPGILFQGENTDPDTIMKLGQKISKGESFSGELLNYRKDGSEFWVHFTLNPILNEKKEIIKYVAVESDITERKKVEKELIKAKEQAVTSMKAKDQFLSMVSHELRTPLNAVIGMTHLLLQEDPRDDQLQNLRSIKTSGEYLLALINDILDFSKIEAGKVSIDHTNFSFRGLIQTLEQTFFYNAQEKNIRFFVDISPEIPNALVGDPVRLNQILVNLIGNSIKFTDAGYVKLVVRCLSEDENTIHLKFTVVDTGIGIPADKLSIIFERFEQVSNSTKRGGTGLGLAITKSLVELMGGSIKADSEVGNGSEFTFDLYFEAGDEKQLEDTKTASYNIIDNLDDIYLLLVEDNKINQLVAAKFLKQWKIMFDIADNGQKAIEMALDHKYDMILMDLQMPILDGVSATKEIRKLPGYHFIPIVALTAASLEAKDEVYQAGMNDFLIKPFNPVELYNKIKKYAGGENKNLKKGKENLNELDISGIQRISDGDSTFLLELLNMCVDQFKNLPRQLLIAMKENNFTEARGIIHKISPSIKMLQYYQLEKTTLELNKLLKSNNQTSTEVETKTLELISIISKMEKLLEEKAKELNNKLIVKER